MARRIWGSGEPPWRGGYSIAWGFNPRRARSGWFPARVGPSIGRIGPIGRIRPISPPAPGLARRPDLVRRLASHLGLKPQAIEYPPFHGDPPHTQISPPPN